MKLALYLAGCDSVRGAFRRKALLRSRSVSQRSADRLAESFAQQSFEDGCTVYTVEVSGIGEPP